MTDNDELVRLTEDGESVKMFREYLDALGAFRAEVLEYSGRTPEQAEESSFKFGWDAALAAIPTPEPERPNLDWCAEGHHAREES